MSVFIEYPKVAPLDALAYFAPVLRGDLDAIDINTAINAGAAIEMWALGKTFPVGGTAGDPGAMSVMSSAEAADVLDQLGSGAIGANAAVPWELLIPIVLEGIKKLIERRRKSG